MKKMKMLLAVATVSLFMSTTSCDKDKKDEPIPPIENEVCYLTQMNWVDDEDIVSFEYDDNHRLIKIFDNEGFSELIIYNSEGKIEKVTIFDEVEEKLRAHYNWEVKRVTITADYKTEEGTWENEDYKIIIEFDAEGHAIKERELYLNDDTWMEYSYSNLTWANGNLIKSEYWVDSDKKISAINLMGITRFSDFFSPISKDYIKEGTTTYEYDNKKNMFQVLSGYYDVNQSKNNILKETYTDADDGETEISENSYEYNDKGYPSKMVTKWIYNDDEDISKVLLEYECP